MGTFCETCREFVDYNEELNEKQKKIKGLTISYLEKIAHCKKCGEEIFVSELRDYNLKVLDSEYRKAAGLISMEDISTILEKYNIGKRPLSLLLGWGEGTLTRYVNGDIPTKAYSDKLKQILDDEPQYMDLLERNKYKITTVAYNKSKNSIDKPVGKVGSKLESSIKYLLTQTVDITPLALQKLLYFTQGFSVAFLGSFLFEEDCEAWVHGPVYKDIYKKYKNYGYNPIEIEEVTLDTFDLTEDEKELLDQIVRVFGCYSGKTLEKMTHSELPWRSARRGLQEWEKTNRVIGKDDIELYFTSVKEKYSMLNFPDITDYARDLFNKLYV